MNKKKIFLIAVVSLIIIAFLFTYILSNRNIPDNNKKNNPQKNYDIVETSESDPEIIKEIFADGMNTEDYKKILDQKENYVKSNGKYIPVEYNFERKYHYSELEEIYNMFNNSDIVQLEIIGKSRDNRNIYGIEVGKGNKVLYLDANMHAAEIANTLILTKFLSEIINEYENGNEEIINILNQIKIAVVPTMNPDGYDIYNYGPEVINNKNLWVYQNKNKVDFENIKSNADGVDLNRNFPAQSSGLYHVDKKLISSVSYERTTKRLTYFGGESVGSEPETQASMYFMLKHYKNTYAYINMHSQGRIMYVEKPNLSNEFNDISMNFAKKIKNITGYGIYGGKYEEIGEGNDGTAGDFMAELANGFTFSSKTGRLSTDKYKDNNCKLEYAYPVIVLETIRTYTTDPSYFKTEYYDKGLREMLYQILEEYN